MRKLIAALRSERGQPKVPEMSELLMKYFKGTRRHRGEGMGTSERPRPTRDHNNPWPGIKESQDV